MTSKEFSDSMAGRAKTDVDGYLETIDRLEPDIYMIDAGAFYASMAISARRQADAVEQQTAVVTEYIAYLRERDKKFDELTEG